MNRFTRGVLFFLFFFSGFASLVYQVVWTRMAFASFGIITPVLSVVLSVFMLGLAIGSWLGGRFIASLVKKSGLSAVGFYASTELLIGLGAFAVPKLFVVCERILLPAGQMDSFSYLLFSALALAISIFPWCVCMGTTFPFMMSYVRELDARNTESFSFLYLANVLGAMSGTFFTAVVLVETLGFHHTLWVAAAGNFTIAFISACLAWEQQKKKTSPVGDAVKSAAPMPVGISEAWSNKLILFSTGFAAMTMEVVWSRAFAVVLKTQVYSFALIVFTYLGATFLGSLAYRRDLHRNRVNSKGGLFSALAITAFLPVLADDPRIVLEQFWISDIDPVSAFILLGSICPFCALLGYLTPRLIDEYSAGQPRRGHIWEMFRIRLLEPLFNDAPQVPYDQLIESFGLKSPTDASNMLLSAKRMFKTHLTRVIKEYAGQDARRGQIERDNAAMGVCRAHHAHVQLMREIDVAGELAAAGDQRRVFQPRDRLADPRHFRRSAVHAAARSSARRVTASTRSRRNSAVVVASSMASTAAVAASAAARNALSTGAAPESARSASTMRRGLGSAPPTARRGSTILPPSMR